MKNLLFLILLWPVITFYPFHALSQEAEAAADNGYGHHFLAQQQAFPQEKVYLHNDKPFYIVGEDVWFRVYLLDYASHLPDSTSRYVYVELVNPADSIVRRVKIRREEGIYKGYISLSEDIAEGEYQLRCYTRFMDGLGEDYFFRRKVTVGGEKGGKTQVYKTHEQFIPVPASRKEYDVSFFAEGGNLPVGKRVRVGFKALGSNGLGERVNGEVFSKADPSEPVTSFVSNPLGTGSFSLEAEEGKAYYAVCRNESGDERTFDLPEADSEAVSLQCVRVRDALNMAVACPPGKRLSSGMRLIAHCRGNLLYDEPWDTTKEYIRFRENMFPSGVIHFLLVDEGDNPVSERLVFNLDEADLAQVSFETGSPSYKYREHVRSEISLTDHEGSPLEGSFSVSVTDGSDISPDSTQNILTALLLTSELKGYIEYPSWYLEEGNLPEIDHLMLTQGWRRYNIPEVLKGNIEQAKGMLEIGPEISGHITCGFFLQNKGKNYSVTLMSFNPSVYETAVVDEIGRYRFNHIELPDSTWYVIQALSPKGSKRCELFIDEEVFPGVKHHIPRKEGRENLMFETYIQKAERKYTDDHGIRTIHLPEVSVTAKRKKGKSPISIGIGRIIPLEEIEKKKNSAGNLYVFFKSIGPLQVDRDKISWSGGGSPMILVDEVEFEDLEFIYGMTTDLIEEIELVRPEEAGYLAGKYGAKVAGLKEGSGAILITSKAHDGGFPQREGYQKKTFIPLGYQKPKEFYSPRYETEEQTKAVFNDLRTTLYWNPDVQTNREGKAEIDFYAADAETTYTVIIEGITNDGKLIRKEGMIERK